MFGPLRFTPIFMERVWGGTKMADYVPGFVPGGGPIGEAWLVSDHPSAVSVVNEGKHRGKTLRELLQTDADAILGRSAQLTPHGRFPLLLKILDSGAPLSVQVHPDDACAARLGEPDVGKTEMWHVIDADPGSELVCGLNPALDAAGFCDAVECGRIEEAMRSFEAAAGDSVFVSAGTVHAIGGGILLAEIQQNSDLTYRIYDYGRLGTDGKPRDLHLDKASEAIRFGSSHAGKTAALTIPIDDVMSRHVLSACRYFAAERLELMGDYTRDTRGESFHIVLCVSELAGIKTRSGETVLSAGEAALVPAAEGEYTISSGGAALLYYVPDLARDIVEPLLPGGHSHDAIMRLGGDPATSDLAGLL